MLPWRTLRSLLHTRELAIVSVLFALMIMNAALFFNIMVLYLQHSFGDWSAAAVGQFLSLELGFLGVAAIVVLPLLHAWGRTWLHDEHLIRLGVLGAITQLILYAVGTHSWQLYTICSLGLLTGLAIPTIRFDLSVAVNLIFIDSLIDRGRPRLVVDSMQMCLLRFRFSSRLSALWAP
jgi:Na+/melibiose symporter-like transporter